MSASQDKPIKQSYAQPQALEIICKIRWWTSFRAMWKIILYPSYWEKGKKKINSDGGKDEDGTNTLTLLLM